ncbi:hypothetical protein HPB52_012175 [Rhipicephalus sanguineus]|uniref:Uncharacterized protein n=1 Tax=Rhipicephalus sanguineus TaxID=34632 RepID=A0A9D4SUE9_RHISA|nr:hypothetical protein HPB52_012175 [Rhipicephalus sanguineus]
MSSRSADVKNVASILAARSRILEVLQAAVAVAAMLSPAARSAAAAFSAVVITSSGVVSWRLVEISPQSADSDGTVVAVAIACVAAPLRRGIGCALPPRSADIFVGSRYDLWHSERVSPLVEVVAIEGCLCVGLLHRGVCRSPVPLGSADAAAAGCDDSLGCTAHFFLCGTFEHGSASRFRLQNYKTSEMAVTTRVFAAARVIYQCCQSPRSNHKPLFTHEEDECEESDEEDECDEEDSNEYDSSRYIETMGQAASTPSASVASGDTTPNPSALLMKAIATCNLNPNAKAFELPLDALATGSQSGDAQPPSSMVEKKVASAPATRTDTGREVVVQKLLVALPPKQRAESLVLAVNSFHGPLSPRTLAMINCSLEHCKLCNKTGVQDIGVQVQQSIEYLEERDSLLEKCEQLACENARIKEQLESALDYNVQMASKHTLETSKYKEKIEDLNKELQASLKNISSFPFFKGSAFRMLTITSRQNAKKSKLDSDAEIKRLQQERVKLKEENKLLKTSSEDGDDKCIEDAFHELSSAFPAAVPPEVSADDFEEANCNVQAVASLADEYIVAAVAGTQDAQADSSSGDEVRLDEVAATRTYSAAKVAAAFGSIRRFCGYME